MNFLPDFLLLCSMALVTQVHKDALALLDEEQKKRKLSVKDMVIDIKASNFFSASWVRLS